MNYIHPGGNQDQGSPGTHWVEAGQRFLPFTRHLTAHRPHLQGHTGDVPGTMVEGSEVLGSILDLLSDEIFFFLKIDCLGGKIDAHMQVCVPTHGGIVIYSLTL